jgi:Fe2+ or Zn2+ uptake regulation protein
MHQRDDGHGSPDEEGKRAEQAFELVSAQSIMTQLDYAGLKRSQPRQILSEYIARKGMEGEDFTIEGLWHEVRRRHPGIGRFTVFRMIDVLVAMGMVDRLTFDDGTISYHVRRRGDVRQYMTCERCHKVVELDSDVAPHLLYTLAHLVGFVLSQHHIEIAGLCPDCQKQ